jgi:hypothetical protein
MVRWIQPWIMIALLAVAHILLSALIDPFGPNDEDWKAYLAIGAWYAQPILFGLWLALGTGSFSMRFQVTILAFALVLFAGVMSASFQSDSEDVQVRVAMLLVTAVGMHIARRWIGWRIVREHRHEVHFTGPVRFNIKSLLVWTAFLAVLLAIGRITWPFISPLRLGSFDEIALGTFIFAVVFGPLVFVSLSLLSTRFVSGFTIATLAGWPFAILAATLLLAIVEPSAPDTIGVFFLVAAGSALACCLTVLPLRLVGYRWMKSTSANSIRGE